MLLGTVILITTVSILPTTLSRHIDNEVKQDSNSDLADDSSHSRRQLQKTYLRFHSKPPHTLHVQEGDDEFLECQAGGSPAPTVHWLKNGRRVSQTKSEDSSSSDSGSSSSNKISFTNSRLYLDCLSLEDEAKYSCVVENPYQRTSTTTRVIVSSSDDEILCRKKLHGKQPRIHQWTKTMITNQGQATKLVCRADGYPRPSIRWLGSNGKELGKADTNKYEILSNGDMVIQNLTWSDMDIYICVASNVHGESRVESFLYPSMPDP